METSTIINYSLYTKLPTKIFQKADKLNPVIEVITPHKGVVFVEIKRIDKGIFRKATEISKETKDVIGELSKLECEAKDYLLNNWIDSFNN